MKRRHDTTHPVEHRAGANADVSGHIGAHTALAGRLGSSWSFGLPVGRHIDASRSRGYYIDLAVKAASPQWPPPWYDAPPGGQLYVGAAQWGLGAHERYLDGQGDEWLAGALGAGDHLVASQASGGPRDGGWVHRFAYPHSYRLDPPWMSAMAQGQGASLLVRLHLATGRDDYAEAALRALWPLRVPSEAGGVAAELDGRPFPEEFPTDPPSFVLNGGIFALWGLLDVGVGLGEGPARDAFEEGVDTLAANVHRWDTGSWSLYDLYPHAATNVASPAYHELHVNQLRAMGLVAPRPTLDAARARFEYYGADPRLVARAFARKVLFRVVVPRNRWVALRLPWVRGGQR